MHAACESIHFSWQQPADLAPAQISHYSVLVTRVASTGDVAVFNQSVGLSTRFRVGSLFAATTYNVQVRAHNPKGSSNWSSRLLTTTSLPTKKPKALPAPGVLASQDSCELQLTVALPSAEGEGSACHGVESLDVQILIAGSAQWKTVLSQVVQTRLHLQGLEAAAAMFRLLAHNRLGASPPGEATPRTPVIVPGLPGAGTRIPKVRATGSASFAIELPTATARCLSALTWTVFGSIADQPDEDVSAWSVLATLGQGLQPSVDRMRCPSSGCKFRLRPDVPTFDDDDLSLMGPVMVAHNTPLPSRPSDAARVEILLKGIDWNSLQRRELRRTLERKLDLPQEPTVVEEHTFPGGVYMIVDLLAASTEDADRAAQLLAAILGQIDRQDGSLGLLQRVDASSGVHQETGPGEWTRVHALPLGGVSNGMADRIASMGLKWIGTLVAGILVCCCGLLAWVRCVCCNSRRRPKGAMPLAQDDPLDRDDFNDTR